MWVRVIVRDTKSSCGFGWLSQVEDGAKTFRLKTERLRIGILSNVEGKDVNCANAAPAEEFEERNAAPGAEVEELNAGLAEEGEERNAAPAEEDEERNAAPGAEVEELNAGLSRRR
jgi:hypothetical protein